MLAFYVQNLVVLLLRDISKVNLTFLLFALNLSHTLSGCPLFIEKNHLILYCIRV